MPIFQKFHHRSSEKEIIDDFSMTGEEVLRTFKTIERVNAVLGGNRILVDGVKQIIRRLPESKDPIRIYDLGCGSGDGLRAIARWGRKDGVRLELTGIDANAFIVNHAKEQARNFPEIRFLQRDIFDADFTLAGADIITFNLCLHHFTEEENMFLLNKCGAEGVRAVLVNDLHRHWLAYYAFGVFCRLTGANTVARKDGLLSILKGFKKQELQELGQKSGIPSPLVRWRWAFRYEMALFYPA